jgi:hypothetical protein
MLKQARCGDMSTAAAPSLACERHSIRGSMHNRGKNFPKLACSTLGSCNPWPLTTIYTESALVILLQAGYGFPRWKG